MSIRVKIWGCRGSIACPAPTHLKYGGNTTCLEVDAGDQKILLDCGTGIRNLGQQLIKSDIEHCYILMTHTHWDHINGFPFFAPAFDPNRKIDIMAGHMADKGGIRNVLEAQMENPMFPIPLDAMQAQLSFSDFRAGEDLDIAKNKSDMKVRTALLNHPNDATGYRIEYKGKSMCLITDTEHIPGKPDENILDLIEGADLVIYDATYTEEEFPSRVGWGHSTWNEGVKLCQMANAKRLGIFHHDPEHGDIFMDNLAAEAKKAWDGTFVVQENMDFLVE
ncbi:MAG: MBL fold metallo-hydrolase [Rhodospirillaceae bacterium]|jgi:phosphoribosyl 1,2-cyclic phosphodiesterase|nr:MBL fold metallo-hydrolase [Rhodospirillaceae bacterium]